MLGAPIHPNGVNHRLKRLCTEAGVRHIKVHGTRHTCATLLLAAGVQPHTVQRRLGLKNIQITLDTYSHVLPGMQADAAARLAQLLHG